MKVIDIKWTPNVNKLIILCDCGKKFEHRLDRWWVRCKVCGRKQIVDTLRNEFVFEKLK